ncbi:hypothetical protein [Reichenbachiella agariperforans]|nr:hypothetical protein [Reichenbachiella agariperforans]
MVLTISSLGSVSAPFFKNHGLDGRFLQFSIILAFWKADLTVSRLLD